MGMLPMLGRSINLSPTQRDQIKAIADSHKDEWKGLADRARTAHQALNNAVTADSVDEALIRQKSSEVAAVDADMAVARAHAHAEVFQLLTSDQKTQLKKMQTDRQNRMKNRPQARLGRLLDHLGL
jgi:Spy/CpxP family protein refolding chaperone